MGKNTIDSIIETALTEDMPQGDITSESIIPPETESKAILLAKEEGVLAGINIARRVFEKIDPAVTFKTKIDDGQIFKDLDTLAELEGCSISLLKGERTALNFLQRLSGIASMTRKYVQALRGAKTRILDTRKTTPGLRILEKYAVRMGGGFNHRFNLSEMVLIKDNHLNVVGNISQAVKKIRAEVGRGMKIEVEATCLEHVKEAVRSGADWVMLDNMPVEEMREVVQWVSGRILLEISGEVTLDRVEEMGALGVDYISVGALTHSYQSIDISMEFLG